MMSVDGTQVLCELLEGNRRYVSNNQGYPNQSDDRRCDLLDAQSPQAIILGCSDSRVPPEIIFDQGLGDLFTPEVKEAWTAVYGVLSDTMKGAAAKAA